MVDMNDVYAPREAYSITGDMCYENKIMMNTSALPERPTQQPQACVNIPASTDSGKTQQAPAKRFRLRMRTPVVVNTVVVFVVATLLALLEFGVIPQTRVGFYCKDPKLSFHYEGETVTMSVLLVSCAAVPLLTLVLVETLRERGMARLRLSTVWLYYKEYLIGVTVVLLLTEVGKVVMGELRPHFLETCAPDVACAEGTYVEEYACTGGRYSWYFVLDASRSFPSGHASATAFVAAFCSYIVQKRLPTSSTGRLLKPLLICALLTYSIFVSLSRITDHRHHWWDVLAGAFLGVCGAIYTLLVVESRVRERLKPSRASTSTTTLLDVKAKDATSVCL